MQRYQNITSLLLLLCISTASSSTSFAESAFISTTSHTQFTASISHNPCTHTSKLYAKRKQCNRAKYEKEFEEMMGDDWRTFRAKLVAYEKAEAECMNESMKSQLPKDSDDNDDDGKKFTQFISKGLSSIFTSGSPNKIPKQHHATSNVNIEDQNHEFISPSLPLNQEEGEFRDPFASVDEVFALNSDFDLITQHISLDKHHWAHPISHIEPGCVLLANEKLGGEFRQTVVLIADHHDTIGSSGLVINR